ncbi:hypothetical protein PROFUN_07317 [Planoprotostelium fungivorum]|uniref:Dienelactone hydrolase domain-containing protein n=1 Tax=Planoprotostelium fungivorum TaxID=1890364 RepID=A0A2P6NM71_9EUKA|nr:hypothetical protein PROFUN_07317 [Planoprotostelium fungivorum]
MSQEPCEGCKKDTIPQTPTHGKFIEVAGVNTYVSTPTDNKHDRILLFYTDIYGPNFLNNQALADYFASHGYLVLAPDFFNEEKLEEILKEKPDLKIIDWARSNGFMMKAPALLEKWLPEAKKKYGTDKTKYVVVGYCFGGPSTMNAGAKEDVSAVAVAHPSAVTEAHFQALKVPLLICASEQDFIFRPELRQTAEKILRTKSTPEGAEGNLDDHRVGAGDYHFQFVLYSGVSHGFAVHNPKTSAQRWAKEDAARQMLSWFNRFTEQ